MKLALTLLIAIAQTTGNSASPKTPFDPPSICPSCDEWNQPQEPFKLHGRSYFVGTRGLSAVVIRTSAGLILLDGGLPQSAPLIANNIRSLGLKVEDIKLIVNSHAHYDHAGGIPALQRLSGASVASSPAGAQAMMAGGPVPTDPQYGVDGTEGRFPRVPSVRVVKDGEALRVGDASITAHFTPGHTPGSTTWTWESCEGSECLQLVYADSLTAVSLDGFRFLGDKAHPDISETFRSSIAKVSALPCDLMLSTHPAISGLFERLDRRTPSGPNTLIDKEGCRNYAANALRNLDTRLSKERAETAK